MNQETGNDTIHEHALRALKVACSRSEPVSVVRTEYQDSQPHSRGRLIAITDDHIKIDGLQVIGRHAMVGEGDEVTVFYAGEEVIYTFRTTIASTSEPVTLENGVEFDAVVLAQPRTIERGQRRTSFRVSLAMADQTVEVEVFGPLEAQVRTGWQPRSGVKPDLTGTIVDASERGIGLLIRDEWHTRFRVFDRWACRFTLPESNEVIDILAEVRRAEAIEDVKRRDVRLGMSVLAFAEREQQFRLAQWLSIEERNSLRRRRGAA